ncbi:MAG: XdhC family protein, partial [Chloroflexota bacterium]
MVDGGERGALATVVACRGSTPRKAGARMLIR